MNTVYQTVKNVQNSQLFCQDRPIMQTPNYPFPECQLPKRQLQNVTAPKCPN